eukprot:2336488-Pleurochrysis_carterae.AAC.1
MAERTASPAKPMCGWKCLVSRAVPMQYQAQGQRAVRTGASSLLLCAAPAESVNVRDSATTAPGL